MEQHILIEHTTRKPYSSSPTLPQEAVFNTAKGYWMSEGRPLFSLESKCGTWATKKCDQETGEDQKGE